MGVTEPEYRQAMPWTSEDNCYEKFKEWAMLRKYHPALKKGDYHTVLTDDEKGIYAFSREFEKDKIVVVLNNSDEAHTVELAGTKICLTGMTSEVIVQK